jgi:rRNA maturation endonuclease Nob1
VSVLTRRTKAERAERRRHRREGCRVEFNEYGCFVCPICGRFVATVSDETGLVVGVKDSTRAWGLSEEDHK